MRCQYGHGGLSWPMKCGWLADGASMCFLTDHAVWCEPADGTRIGDPRNRGDEELRTGRLIGEGNALIDFNEYNNVDSSMGEAQREVVDRI